MSDNKAFRIALIISLGVHAGILLQYPQFNILPSEIKKDVVKVNYLKEPRKPPAKIEAEQSRKMPLPNLPDKITLDKNTPPKAGQIKDAAQRPSKSQLPVSIFNKPRLAKPDIIAIKKKITLPALDIDKINNPSYISYYQIVREKIRRSAYQNYTRTETGEVYLSFLITREGYLQEARLREEKSSPNPYLREIAMRSVKEASPFPSFPKGLDYPQLSFNVVISFEIE